MLRYEVLFLTVPEITGDEAGTIESYFSKSVRNVKGNLLAFDRWGKYRLAYSVKHNDYGVYFLTRFEVAAESRDALLKDVKNAFVFKFNNLVMKSMVTRLDEQASLDYKRLESLEDNPHDVDSFLKKNDMGGLLHKDASSAKSAKPSPVVTHVDEENIDDKKEQDQE